MQDFKKAGRHQSFQILNSVLQCIVTTRPQTSAEEIFIKSNIVYFNRLTTFRRIPLYLPTYTVRTYADGLIETLMNINQTARSYILQDSILKAAKGKLYIINITFIFIVKNSDVIVPTFLRLSKSYVLVFVCNFFFKFTSLSSQEPFVQRVSYPLPLYSSHSVGHELF